MGRYRVLVSKHIQNDSGGNERVYNTGEVVESDYDLCLLNGPGMTPKFERLGGDGHPAHSPREPDRDLRAENERLRAELAAIRGAQAPGPASLPAASDEDLARRAGFSEERPPSTLADRDKVLSSMTLPELRAYAADEEIDLHGARTKEEILKAIRDGE